MKPYRGSCHCGGIRFAIDFEPEELTTCDCSLCVKRNAVMTKVPEAALSIAQGADLLATDETSGTPAAPSTTSARPAASTSSTASAPPPTTSA